jgi:uncharacterized protein YjbI with pentapeptide repeats
MVVRLRFWWQKIQRHPMTAIVLVVTSLLGVALIVLIILGYWLSWNWTGFNSGESKITITTISKGSMTAIESQPTKHLWDWLQPLGILAIPVVVGIGTVWFTTKQGQVSNAENKDNQRETALQTYINKMSELLLHEKLRSSANEDEVQKIARVRTLTVLRGLDADRKASVLQFLREAGLIDKNKCIIDLSEAQLLEANLHGANLRGADLHETNLSGANLSYTNLLYTNLRGANLTSAKLSEANLRGANLREADLHEADLTSAKLFAAKLFGARLIEANLRGADLREANLSGANLHGANLHEANLSRATVTTEQLEKAKSFKNTIMPDGSIHQ